MPLYRKHTIYLPFASSVLDERLNGRSNSIIYVFRLSFTFYLYNLNVPSFECLSEFVQLPTVSLSLGFQCLLFLGNHVLQFRDLGILLLRFLWRRLILLPCFQCFFFGLFSLIYLGLSPTFFNIIQLFLDFILV